MTDGSEPKCEAVEQENDRLCFARKQSITQVEAVDVDAGKKSLKEFAESRLDDGLVASAKKASPAMQKSFDRPDLKNKKANLLKICKKKCTQTPTKQKIQSRLRRAVKLLFEKKKLSGKMWAKTV